MMEQNNEIWYRLRGPGLVCLCALLCFFGSRISQKSASIAVSSTGESSSPVVYLTFETVYGKEPTEEILDILASYQAKAAFFVTEEWAEKYPDTVERMDLEGHKVRTLSKPGKNGSGLSAADIEWDIDSEDWKNYGAASVAETVLQNPGLKNRAVIRFHSGTRDTAEALGDVICGLREKGYELAVLFT